MIGVSTTRPNNLSLVCIFVIILYIFPFYYLDIYYLNFFFSATLNQKLDFMHKRSYRYKTNVSNLMIHAYTYTIFTVCGYHRNKGFF